MNADILVGKTIASVEYIDNCSDGIHIHFTDRSCLSISEQCVYISDTEVMPHGEIIAIYDGEVLDPEDDEE